MRKATAKPDAPITIDVQQVALIAQQSDADVAELHEVAKALVIEDEETYALAGEALVDVQRRLDALEQQRTGIVKPMNDAVRRVNALFKPATDRLQRMRALFKEAMVAFTTRRREEQQRLLAEAAARDLAARQAAPEASGPLPGPAPGAVTLMEAAQQAVVPHADGIVMQYVWQWELVDEAQVPREFLTVDPRKINEAVRRGVREIPGVRVFQIDRAVIRT